MSPFLLGAALVVVAGALVALSAWDNRLVLAGLVLSLGLAPLVAAPVPPLVAVAARVVAAVLGAQLLLIVLRAPTSRVRGAAIGPVGPVLGAAAAFVVGYAGPGLGFPADGPREATAAGLALLTIALGPVLLGRDVLRLGVGLAVLVTAAELIRAGLGGTPGAVEQIASAGLTVAVLGVTAAIAASALRAGHDLAIDRRAPRETLFEAHRLADVTSVKPRRSSAGRSTEAGRAEMARGGRGPAAGPRRDAAAHQLTLEERVRRSSDPAQPVAPGEPVGPADDQG